MKWYEAVLVGASFGWIFLGSLIIIKWVLEMEQEDDEKFRTHVIREYGMGSKGDEEWRDWN